MGRPVVITSALGKRYRIGDARAGYATLREQLAGVPARARRAAGLASAERREFWALRGVDLEIGEGEVVGIVGRNGAGKSTLLKILSRITEPTEGRVGLRGRVGSLLEVGTGFHPELTGRENVYLNGAILGMRRADIRRRFDDIVEFAGIEEFLDTPVKRYSSGMYVRLAFAVAAHLEPEVLLIDEVLAVGDVAFQQRCLGRMGEIARSGRTVLFVSHNLAAVSSLCDRACLIDHGHVVEDGPTDAVLRRYMALVHEGASESLTERLDRRGNGALRFTSADVRGADDALRPGSSATVDLSFEAPDPVANVMVGLAVTGPLGEPVFLCSTRLTGQEIATVSRSGVFRCEIPSLPLLPGRYSMNIYAEANGIITDWIEDAASFEIAADDFFGSGQLPPDSHGRLLLAHSWSVREAA